MSNTDDLHEQLKRDAEERTEKILRKAKSRWSIRKRVAVCTSISLAVVLVIVFAVPASRLYIFGFLRGDSSYERRPARYWAYYLEDYRTAKHFRWRLEQGGDQAIPVLNELLRHSNYLVSREACTALAKLAPEHAEAVAGLIVALESEHYETQHIAVERLGTIAPQGAEAIPALITVLNRRDNDEPLKLHELSAEALGKHGPAADAAVSRLKELLSQPLKDRPDTSRKQSLHYALSKIQPKACDGFLLSRHNDPYIRSLFNDCDTRTLAELLTTRLDSWNDVKTSKFANAKCLALSPDGRSIASSANRSPYGLYVAGLQPFKMRWGRGKSSPSSIAFSHDGTIVAMLYVGHSGPFYFDAESGIPILEEFRQTGVPRRTVLAFSPVEKLLAVGSEGGAIALLDLEAKEIRSIWHGAGHVYFLRFSPDGTELASVGDWRYVKIWDVESGDRIDLDVGASTGRFCTAFCLGGKAIASPIHRMGDIKVLISHIESGEKLAELRWHRSYIMNIGVTADGRTLITCCADGWIKFWDLSEISVDSNK